MSTALTSPDVVTGSKLFHFLFKLYQTFQLWWQQTAGSCRTEVKGRRVDVLMSREGHDDLRWITFVCVQTCSVSCVQGFYSRTRLIIWSWTWFWCCSSSGWRLSGSFTVRQMWRIELKSTSCLALCCHHVDNSCQLFIQQSLNSVWLNFRLWLSRGTNKLHQSLNWAGSHQYRVPVFMMFSWCAAVWRSDWRSDTSIVVGC